MNANTSIPFSSSTTARGRTATAASQALQRHVKRHLRRLQGLAYAVVAASAAAAAGLQPPHARDVEVGTVSVATAPETLPLLMPASAKPAR
jgi:hypothetical protein